MSVSRQHGFTLMELLVTAGILTLLISTGIPSFRRFGRVSELEIGAEEAKSAILEVRSYALSPRADAVLMTGCATDSYGIAFIVGTNEYQLKQGACDLGERRKLPPSMLVDQEPGVITFSVTDGGRITTPSTNPVIRLVHRQLDSTSRTITVNKETGAVSISNGATP